MPTTYNADIRLFAPVPTDPAATPPPQWMTPPPPSEVDYAECVATNCNMDIETMDPSFPVAENVTSFSFSLPASNPRVSLEEAPNSTITSNIDISTEPSPPKVILYSANVPADPSLWDGNFMATSLFSTNEFLNSDINNVMCSLKRMACFLRQRNVKDRDTNSIRQLDPFGESTWDFISAIFESGWDTLITANKSFIRDNVTKEFGKSTKPSSSANTRHGAHITKVPPPIPPRPSKEILEKSKAHQQKISNKGKFPLSYAQIASNVTNALKIKEAFPALPNKKCTMQLLANTSTEPKKSNSPPKDRLENRPLSWYTTNLLKASWVMPVHTYSKSILY